MYNVCVSVRLFVCVSVRLFVCASVCLCVAPADIKYLYSGLELVRQHYNMQDGLGEGRGRGGAAVSFPCATPPPCVPGFEGRS